MSGTPTDWLTPEQLAVEWSRPVRWIRQQMASGNIPSVKVAGFRFFTPACRAALEEKALPAPRVMTAEEAWGRPPKRGRA